MLGLGVATPPLSVFALCLTLDVVIQMYSLRFGETNCDISAPRQTQSSSM